MNSPLFFSVIWWCLASLSGALYLFKPHVYFLVAGSGACAVAILHMAMHLLVAPRT